MTTLCSIHDLEDDQAKGFSLEGLSLVAVKKDGQYYVYKNSCPHLGIPLEFMPDEFLDMERRFIQCANHGALFEIETGACIAGPCTGQSLKSVSFKIHGEHIVITQSE